MPLVRRRSRERAFVSQYFPLALVLIIALLLIVACRGAGSATSITNGPEQYNLPVLQLPAEPTMLPPLVEISAGLPRHITPVKEVTAVGLGGSGFTAFARVELRTAADQRWKSDLVAAPGDQERLMRWNGQTWTPVDDPLLAAGSPRFTVDHGRGWLYANGVNKQDSGEVYFLLRSTDGGATWQHFQGWETQVGALARAIVPTADGSIAVDIGDGRIVVTRDAGVTWSPVPLPVADDSSVLARWELVGAGPKDSHTISVSIFKPAPGAVEAVLYATTDGGQTWMEVGTPTVGNALPLADPADASKLLDSKAPPFNWKHVQAAGTTVWATAYDAQETNKPAREVWRSTDAGATWARSALPGRTILTSIAAVDELTAVVSSTDMGVLLTQDGGLTWQTLDAGLPTVAADVTALTAAVEDGHTLLVAASERTVYRSTDQGQSWTSLGAPWTGDHHRILGVLADPSRNLVYALRDGGRGTMAKDPALSLWRDGAWQTLPAAPTNSKQTSSTAYPRLIADPWQAGAVYALVGKSVYHSRDQGQTWQPIDFGLRVDPDDNYSNGVLSIAFDPPNRTIYAGIVLGSDQSIVLTSRDQGSSWSGMQLRHRLVAASQATQGLLYLPAWDGNMRVQLPDGSLRTLREPHRFVGTRAVAMAATVPETVLTDANFGSQVAIINVDLATWHSAPLPLRKPGDGLTEIDAIVTDPVDPQRFYVSTDIGVFTGTLPSEAR